MIPVYKEWRSQIQNEDDNLSTNEEPEENDSKQSVRVADADLSIEGIPQGSRPSLFEMKNSSDHDLSNHDGLEEHDISLEDGISLDDADVGTTRMENTRALIQNDDEINASARIDPKQERSTLLLYLNLMKEMQWKA